MLDEAESILQPQRCPHLFQVSVNVLNKEAVHEESVGEPCGPDQNHGEAVVSDVRKVGGTDDLVDQQTNRVVKLEGVDGRFVFFGGQPKAKRGFEQLMSGFEIQELGELLAMDTVINANWIPILPRQFVSLDGPVGSVRVLEVPHGHEDALVVMNKGLNHQVSDHLRVNQNGFYVLLSGIINDEIEQVTFRLEVPQNENIGFWPDEVLHEKADLPLKEAMSLELNRHEALDVVGDVKRNGQENSKRR